MIETLALIAKYASANNLGLVGLFISAVILLVLMFKRSLNLSFGKLSIAIGNENRLGCIFGGRHACRGIEGVL